MTFSVIESVSKPALDAYLQSRHFQKEFGRAPNVRIKTGVHEHQELDDQGTIGPLYWALVEDDGNEDNATFRLGDDGEPEFWATGVEI